MRSCFCIFFFNDTATTEIYTLSLHDALPICTVTATETNRPAAVVVVVEVATGWPATRGGAADAVAPGADRKSTRLNSSHANISYAVFCLKKNNNTSGDCLGRRVVRLPRTLHE